jgi:hypothetical protein
MKKQSVLLILTILLLSSCTLKATVFFNESIPLEESAWITTSQGEIIGYNGIKVKWKQPLASLNVISIPAGETDLELNIQTQYGYNTYYKASNVLFRYNFLPQKYYDFLFVYQDGRYGFKVYAWDFDEKLMDARSDAFYNGNKHFVEFVPFVNELRFR